MIRVTQAEFIRDTRALYRRARAERESIAVVDEAGIVRMQVDLGTGEPEADPDDAGGEVYWAVCIGVVALGEWARRCAWEHRRPSPLSDAAKRARAPLPPEQLVDARNDRVHIDKGKLIAATPVNAKRGDTDE